MPVTILRKVTVSGGTVLRAANNLGDVASAATAWDNLAGGNRTITGTLTVQGAATSIGPGGTGTDNAIATLNSSNAASYGAQIRLNRNGTQYWTLGHYSGIQGGASNDLLLYNAAASGEALRVSSSGYSFEFGPGGTGTDNSIVVIDGSSAASYGAQLRFNRNSVQKWDVGHHSGIQGGSSDDFLVYNQTAGNESLRIAAATGNLKFGAYGAGTLTTDSSGNVTATSDERAKTNLQPFTKGLAQVVRLTPKSYKWKAETGLNTDDAVVSLTAQDLLAAGLGEAVNTERTVPVMESVEVDGKAVQRQKRDAQGRPMFERVAADYYTVSDRAVIAALVNAVKELAAEVEELKSR